MSSSTVSKKQPPVESRPEVSSPVAPHLAFLFGLDRYVVSTLWPHWREQGLSICDSCGFVRNPDSGRCTANPAHVGQPYGTRVGVRTVVYL